MLSLNIKNLSNEEQTKREEFRQLDSKIKELKNQVQREEHIIKDDLEYVNEIKSYFKNYLKENTTKSLEKLQKMKNENTILKSHLEKAKLDNEALNIHLQKLDLLNLRIKDLIDKKDSLEEGNYNLKSYLRDKNFEEDYQIYIKSLDNNFEFER